MPYSIVDDSQSMKQIFFKSILLILLFPSASFAQKDLQALYTQISQLQNSLGYRHQALLAKLVLVDLKVPDHCRDTIELRDQWLERAKQFGQTFKYFHRDAKSIYGSEQLCQSQNSKFYQQSLDSKISEFASYAEDFFTFSLRPDSFEMEKPDCSEGIQLVATYVVSSKIQMKKYLAQMSASAREKCQNL
jgi:hypothetical protein